MVRSNFRHPNLLLDLVTGSCQQLLAVQGSTAMLYLDLSHPKRDTASVRHWQDIPSWREIWYQAVCRFTCCLLSCLTQPFASTMIWKLLAFDENEPEQQENRTLCFSYSFKTCFMVISNHRDGKLSEKCLTGPKSFKNLHWIK